MYKIDEMRNKIFLTILMLVGLIVLGSIAFGQIQTNAGSSSTAAAPLQTNMSIIKLPEGAVDLKVPINIFNNSSKVYWNSPAKQYGSGTLEVVTLIPQ
jgi:hypothetical protein